MKDDFVGPDEFERLLQRQTVRRIPSGWRSEVLGAAEGARQASAGAGARLGDPLWRRMSASLRVAAATLFTPSPAGWGTLAAVWLALFLVNHHMAAQSGPAVAGRFHVPAEVAGAWREQEQLLTELLGSRDAIEPARAPAAPAGHLKRRSTDRSRLDGPRMTQYPV